jgi:hypothetical protein
MDLAWEIGARGDLDGDGVEDVLWHDPATGANVVWLRGERRSVTEEVAESVGQGWVLVDALDYDGDGPQEIVWRQRFSGDVVLWSVRGGELLSEQALGSVSP